MMIESWPKALGRYFGYSLRVSAATTIGAIAFCWYHDMLTLAALSNALQWAGVLVGGIGVWSLIGTASGSPPGVSQADNFNVHFLLPRDSSLWRSDLLAAYRFSLTVIGAGLMTAGSGAILGSWLG